MLSAPGEPGVFDNCLERSKKKKKKKFEPEKAGKWKRAAELMAAMLSWSV